MRTVTEARKILEEAREREEEREREEIASLMSDGWSKFELNSSYEGTDPEYGDAHITYLFAPHIKFTEKFSNAKFWHYYFCSGNPVYDELQIFMNQLVYGKDFLEF